MAMSMYTFGQMGNATTSNSSASYGNDAGISGEETSYFGAVAGAANAGTENNFFGFSSGLYNTGSYNIFMGNYTAYKNKGKFNAFVGYYSGYGNIYGNDNSFFGASSGRNNKDGINNTFLGSNSGRNNISGTDNTYVGNYSGLKNQNGYYNTFVGSYAGAHSEGKGNVFIGYNAGKEEPGNEKLYIDNSSTSKPLIYGDFFKDRITFFGQVGIGTTEYNDTTSGVDYALSVAGKVRAESVKVYTGWADYVFEDDYILPTLQDVENYIQTNGHLKDIPSANTVEKHGIELGEMNKLLLQKIEELTLYTINQEKRIKALEAKLNKQ